MYDTSVYGCHKHRTRGLWESCPNGYGDQHADHVLCGPDDPSVSGIPDMVSKGIWARSSFASQKLIVRRPFRKDMNFSVKQDIQVCI